MAQLVCSNDIIVTTLAKLAEGAAAKTEKVVLWLAPAKSAEKIHVSEVYEPEQVTAIDVFRIPESGMRALMNHLRNGRLKVVAQVHTHPGRAFHSEADDRWAIVRHAGALSLVLPTFARDATVQNFGALAKTYFLSPLNTWDEVLPGELHTVLELPQ